MSTSRSDTPIDAATLRRYADLIVELGANVQPDQIVYVRSQLGAEDVTRAVVASAYRRGARFVDVEWFDPWVKRARLVHAEDETLDFVPSWHRERVLQLGAQRCARIAFTGGPPLGVYDGIDATKLARDRFPFIREYFQIINDETTNWTGACAPTREWAELVHPDLDGNAALVRLWEDVLHACRVDEADPIGAWHTRLDRVKEARTRLNELALDAVRFEGPGTDLTIGLLPTSQWDSGVATTAGGIDHVANLPTEETFTAPDPERADGVVRATKPLQLGGKLLTGIEIEFRGGRAVRIDADHGADVLRAQCAMDEGASRLGEVALVDRESRVGRLQTVFYTTLLDENAASHIAFGSAYADTVGDADRARINESTVHIDFMIGADEVAVTGVTRGGESLPLLRGGAWQI